MNLRECDLTDIVIDTNVLSHADNPGSPLQTTAISVLAWIKESEVVWAIDDNGKSSPNMDTSLLYREYRATLSPQGLPLALFMSCLQSNRIKFCPRPNKQTRDSIRKLVPRNDKDRVVLGAACGSDGKTLISNDANDFSDDVRKTAKKLLAVSIHRSHEVEYV